MVESEQLLAVELTAHAAAQRHRRGICLQTTVIVILLGLLYHRILFDLVVNWWTDPNSSHGFLVPIFSGFLVWRARQNLNATEIRPSWLGVLLVLLGLAILVVGVLGAELFLSRSSLIVILAGLIISFWGWRYFRTLLPPWLFLFLMVPIPTIVFNQITFPLQVLASRVAAWLLAAIGIPVLRAGNVIQLAAMPLEVAEACSGIRSLTSLVTLALIYGYLVERTPWRIAVLALLAFPIAVLANAMRIVSTGIAVEYWNPADALGFFHEFSGWLMFMFSLGLLFATHSAIRAVGRRMQHETKPDA